VCLNPHVIKTQGEEIDGRTFVSSRLFLPSFPGKYDNKKSLADNVLPFIPSGADTNALIVSIPLLVLFLSTLRFETGGGGGACGGGGGACGGDTSPAGSARAPLLPLSNSANKVGKKSEDADPSSSSSSYSSGSDGGADGAANKTSDNKSPATAAAAVPAPGFLSRLATSLRRQPVPSALIAVTIGVALSLHAGGAHGMRLGPSTPQLIDYT
jgi:hypothetical protein